MFGFCHAFRAKILSRRRGHQTGLKHQPRGRGACSAKLCCPTPTVLAVRNIYLTLHQVIRGFRSPRQLIRTVPDKPPHTTQVRPMPPCITSATAQHGAAHLRCAPGRRCAVATPLQQAVHSTILRLLALWRSHHSPKARGSGGRALFHAPCPCQEWLGTSISSRIRQVRHASGPGRPCLHHASGLVGAVG